MCMGNISEPICEISIELNRVGAVLIGGLNPIAAIEESAIEVETRPMSTVVEYQSLVDFEEVLN